MKNAINYYYDLITNDIHRNGANYYFTIDNFYYILEPFYGDINKLIKIYNHLKNNNIYILEIISNKSNDIVTIIDDKPYVLLRDYSSNRKAKLRDIINYNVYIEPNIKVYWYKLWTTKLDYYEYQMEQFEHQFPLLYESFFYYDGLTELAISLLNQVDTKNINQFISHNRITKNMTLRDLYNPLNLTIDTRVRDTAEYFKIKFFSKEINVSTIMDYVNYNQLTHQEVLLFLIRMIYPSYYFDKYDDIIKGKEKEEKINIIINQVNNYEHFIKDIYNNLAKRYPLPNIEWFKKSS